MNIKDMNWVEDQSLTLDEADISSFENAVGFALPPAYRNFLSERNGGELKNAVGGEWKSALYQGGIGQFFIDRFFSIGGAEYENVRSLEDAFEEMEVDSSAVPAGIFCLGQDYGGNYVTIDLRPETYGHIASVDHELIDENFGDEESYQVFAYSFTEFLQMLQNVDEDGNLEK